MTQPPKEIDSKSRLKRIEAMGEEAPRYPDQCSCGHIYLEKYTFKEPQDGVVGFCWCGFCRTRLNLYTDGRMEEIKKSADGGTPRTDAAYKQYQGLVRASIAAGNLLNESRKIELELNKTKAQLAAYEECDHHKEIIAPSCPVCLIDERDNLQAALNETKAALAKAEAEIDRLRDWSALEESARAATRDLPDGFLIEIFVEKGSGWVRLEDPDGEGIAVNCSDLTLAESVAEATRVAKEDIKK